MSWQKILKIVSIHVVVIIVLELQSIIVEIVNRKIDKIKKDREIFEIVCCRQPKNLQLQICKGIDSDSPTYCTDVLKNIIKSSKTNIYVAQYIFTSIPLVKELIEANQKGVQVYVLLDNSMAVSSSAVIEVLKEKQISVRLFSTGLMHHKFALFDHVIDTGNETLQTKNCDYTEKNIDIPKNGLLAAGSLNWTNDGLHTNREFFFVTSNLDACKTFAKEFEDMWKKSHLT